MRLVGAFQHGVGASASSRARAAFIYNGRKIQSRQSSVVLAGNGAVVNRTHVDDASSIPQTTQKFPSSHTQEATVIRDKMHANLS